MPRWNCDRQPPAPRKERARCLYARRVLPPEGVDQIHQTVLKTLGQIGVVFPHPEAQALFRRAGARVQGDRVYIPEGLLEDTLREVPPSITLYTREGEPAMVLEGHEAHFGTYGTALYWYEPETGERRRGTRQAVGFTARGGGSP